MEQNEATIPQDALTAAIAVRLGARHDKLAAMQQWEKAAQTKHRPRISPLIVAVAVAACLAAVVWVAPWSNDANVLDSLGINAPQLTEYRSAGTDAATINTLISEEKYQEALDIVTAELSRLDDEASLAEEFAEAIGDEEAVYDAVLARDQCAEMRWTRIFLLVSLGQNKEARRELKTYLRYPEGRPHIEDARALQKALR